MSNRRLRLADIRTGIWMATASLGLMLNNGIAMAEEKLGLPTDKAIHLQQSAAPLKTDAIWFHDIILMPIITGITLLVLGLLAWIVIRYNKRTNPVPAKFSHNTTIEVLWTVIPVLILVFIAFFSFSLLRKYNNMPTPDVIVKATGYQWYWAYDYPELGVEGIEQRLLPEARDLKAARAAKVPFLLGVDNELIVPVGKVVQVKVTGYDVIHAFALPAFGLKTDAIPGRLNSTWFKAEKTGTFYGQCSELCGIDHAYMPIAIKVVTEPEFDAYIIKAGGKTRAMIAAEAAKAKLDAELAAQAAAATASAAATAPTTPVAGAPATTTSTTTMPSAAASPAATPPAAAAVQ
jgi:cytochrome c oxidase subunit II